MQCLNQSFARNSFMRRFTTARTSHPLLSICNTLTGEMPYNSTQRMHVPFPSLTPFASLRNRYDGGSVHSVQPPAQRQDHSYSITAEALARGADCCHPYWRNHGRPPLALPCFSCVYHRKQACWNVGADGRPFAAACKDVMILERYYTLPSGILQLSAGVHTVNQQRKWISYSNTTTPQHSNDASSAGAASGSCFDLPYAAATSEDTFVNPRCGPFNFSLIVTCVIALQLSTGARQLPAAVRRGIP